MSAEGFVRPERKQVVHNLSVGFGSLFSSYRLGLQEMFRDEEEIDRIMREACEEGLTRVLSEARARRRGR